MDLARLVAETDPHALTAMVRYVGRPLQSRSLFDVAAQSPFKVQPGRCSIHKLFFNAYAPITASGETLESLVPPDESSHYLLRLGRDIVLSVPWNHKRMADALALYGNCRKAGPWRANGNHRVALMLPFGLGVVYNGYHSLAAGISNAEGAVVSAYTQDFTPVYQHVRYDGETFVRLHDGATLGSPVDEEPGMLFEIGRLMIERGVKFDADKTSPKAFTTQNSPERLVPILYKLFVNGSDTGRDLSESAVRYALLSSGIEQGSVLWDRVLREGGTIDREGWGGRREKVSFEPYTPRRRAHSIDLLFGS